MDTYLNLINVARYRRVLSITFFFLSMLFPTTFVYADDVDFVWASCDTVGTGTDVSIDKLGNVYVIGYEAIDDHGFIMIVRKLDSDGNIIWTKIFESGHDNWSAGGDIALDDSSNLYITGSFVGTVDFDPGDGVFELTSDYMNFITKLDTNGGFVWAEVVESDEWIELYSIFVDNFSNIYICGGNPYYEPGTMYIAKWDDWHGSIKLSISIRGKGLVKSDPVGINCPTDCTELYKKNMSVTLTATPSKGAIFGSWLGGGCKGTETCTVTMDRDRQVIVAFGKEGGIPWALLLLRKKE